MVTHAYLLLSNDNAHDILCQAKGLLMALHDDIANLGSLIDAAIAKAKTDQETADNVSALQAQLDTANGELSASQQAVADLTAKLSA